MLKIATVLMTTSVCAGLLISGPTGLVTIASSPVGQVFAVKVKTIAIHRSVAPLRVASPADVADLLDPNPLDVPAVLAGTSDDMHRA